MPSSAKARPLSLASRLLADAGQGEITSEEQATAAESSFKPVPRALLVPIDRIEPSRDNPRKGFSNLDELAESIAERGVLQPLVLRRDPDRPGYYTTIAGARRLMASLIVRGSGDAEARAKVASLPCVVMDESDHDAFADALAENLAREDLNRSEVMEALMRLQEDYGWSARYIARRIGRSKSDVIELLGIAKDPSIAPMVRDEIITPTTAGQIRRLPAHLRPTAIEGVKSGRVKTGEDVRRIRRDDERERSQQPSGRGRKSTTGAKVTDIGHPGETSPNMDEVSMLPIHPAAMDAASEVVRAVERLTELMALVDAPTLESLRAANDNLARYIRRAEQASSENGGDEPE